MLVAGITLLLLALCGVSRGFVDGTGQHFASIYTYSGFVVPWVSKCAGNAISPLKMSVTCSMVFHDVEQLIVDSIDTSVDHHTTAPLAKEKRSDDQLRPLCNIERTRDLLAESALAHLSSVGHSQKRK